MSDPILRVNLTNFWSWARCIISLFVYLTQWVIPITWMLLHLFCNTHFFLFQSCLDASFFVLSKFLLSNKALSFFNRQRGCDFGQNNGNFRAPSHSRVVSGIFKILQCGPISKGVSQNSSCFLKCFFWYENFCGLDYNRAYFWDFHNFRVTN